MADHSITIGAACPCDGCARTPSVRVVQGPFTPLAAPEPATSRALEAARRALSANHNCLTTDRPDLPRSPETGWTTDFTVELALIDAALALQAAPEAPRSSPMAEDTTPAADRIEITQKQADSLAASAAAYWVSGGNGMTPEEFGKAMARVYLATRAALQKADAE